MPVELSGSSALILILGIPAIVLLRFVNTLLLLKIKDKMWFRFNREWHVDSNIYSVCSMEIETF